MNCLEIFLVEFQKLIKKKITYLLLVTLLIPLVYGVGMTLHLSFIVNSDGESFNVISSYQLSAIGFAVNMFSQSIYVIYLIIIIIGSMLLAGEVENGQIRIYAIRICQRKKWLVMKFFASMVLMLFYILAFTLFSVLVYYIFVSSSGYGNGKFIDRDLGGILYLFITYMGMTVAMSVTFMLGIYLKAFQTFAVSYLVWFISKYLSFFDKLQYLVPDNLADKVIDYGMEDRAWIYVLLYMIYICVLLGMTGFIFNKRDLK